MWQGRPSFVVPGSTTASRTSVLTNGQKGVTTLRRRLMQVQTFVPRRERHGEMMGTVRNAGARMPVVGIDSPPSLSYRRAGHVSTMTAFRAA